MASSTTATAVWGHSTPISKRCGTLRPCENPSNAPAVPIFVLTHEIPKRLPKQTDKLTFTFVTDGIESAIRQARAAAGDRDVTVIGGARTAQQCLRAGLADELHIDIMPVLLRSGLRLFEDIGTAQLQLERSTVVELPAGRTHLRFRVAK